MTDDSIPDDEAARKEAEKKEKRAAYYREYHAKNREKNRKKRKDRSPEDIERDRARARASYHRNKHRNKQKFKERDSKRYSRDKTRMNARRMQHAKDNPEMKRASDKRYYWKNPEKHRASARARHYANWPHKYEVQKIYALMNKERVSRYRRAIASKRRIRIKRSSEHYTGKDVEALAVLQKFKCVYCRTSIATNYQVDHIMPIAKGGDNSRRNIQLLCPKCNKRKAAKYPDDFAKEFSRGK